MNFICDLIIFNKFQPNTYNMLERIFKKKKVIQV